MLGALAAVTGVASHIFALPLMLQMHLGYQDFGKENNGNVPTGSFNWS
jgi:hypothetical protein